MSPDEERLMTLSATYDRPRRRLMFDTSRLTLEQKLEGRKDRTLDAEGNWSFDLTRRRLSEEFTLQRLRKAFDTFQLATPNDNAELEMEPNSESSVSEEPLIDDTIPENASCLSGDSKCKAKAGHTWPDNPQKASRISLPDALKQGYERQ